MKKNILSGKKKGLDMAIAGFFALFISLLGVMFYMKHDRNLKETFHHEMELEASLISQQIEAQVARVLNSLSNLRYRLVITEGNYLNYWELDALRQRKQNPVFLFIEWIDSNGIIRKIQPLEGNEEAHLLNISKIPWRYENWKKAAEESRINFTSWRKLNQPGHAFLVDAPVYYDNTFQGTISAGLNFKEQFDKILKPGNYNLKIFDNQGNLFYEYGDVKQAAAAYKLPLKIVEESEVEWVVEFFPDNASVYLQRLNDNKVRFVAILTLAASMGFMIFYSRQLKRHSKRFKIINKRLNILNKQYESEKLKAISASKVKTEFLSNMSHEIRTPLNAIVGFINLLQQQELSEEQSKYLQMMNSSSENLLSIINNILEIDKIESGKTNLSVDIFTPEDELQRLLDIHYPQYLEKNLALKSEFTSKAYQVKGDKIKFIQIVNNLLRNAYKFTPSGEVILKYEEKVSGDLLKMVIKVADTGIGIPEEKRDQIFKRFSQVDSSYQKQYEGSGLGLAISKRLVEMMGGTINFHSLGSGGTEFVLKLEFPLQEKEEKVFPEQNNEMIFPGMKVLIAEDNPMNIIVLQKVLEQLEVECEVAENGVKVLEKVERDNFHLILMDIHMPEMDGFEATRKLHEADVHIPIVALSANILRDTIDSAKELGICDYITKPFRREDLINVLIKYYKSS